MRTAGALGPGAPLARPARPGRGRGQRRGWARPGSAARPAPPPRTSCARVACPQFDSKPVPTASPSNCPGRAGRHPHADPAPAPAKTAAYTSAGHSASSSPADTATSSPTPSPPRPAALPGGSSPTVGASSLAPPLPRSRTAHQGAPHAAAAAALPCAPGARARRRASVRASASRRWSPCGCGSPVASSRYLLRSRPAGVSEAPPACAAPAARGAAKSCACVPTLQHLLSPALPPASLRAPAISTLCPARYRAGRMAPATATAERAYAQAPRKAAPALARSPLSSEPRPPRAPPRTARAAAAHRSPQSLCRRLHCAHHAQEARASARPREPRSRNAMPPRPWPPTSPLSCWPADEPKQCTPKAG